MKGLGAGAVRSVALTELEARKAAVLLDAPGLGDLRGNSGRPLHDIAPAEHPANPRAALHTVLEGEDRGTPRHQSAQTFRGALRIAHLHSEYDGLRLGDVAG